MTTYDTFSADGHQASWGSAGAGEVGEPVDEQSEPWREEIELRWDNEAWTATGQLAHEQTTYVVRLSPTFAVRQLLLFRDLDEPDLWLGTDGHGRWGEVNGAHRPDLDGTTDVRVGDSVFALGSTIRRLDLPVGGVATVAVAEIDPETLGVVVVRRNYERLGSNRWRVEALPTTSGALNQSGNQSGNESGGLGVEFDVDDHGLPTDLDGIRRLL